MILQLKKGTSIVRIQRVVGYITGHEVLGYLTPLQTTARADAKVKYLLGEGLLRELDGSAKAKTAGGLFGFLN